jgi:ribosome-associated protein
MDELKSKSQKKRDAANLTKIGSEFVHLSLEKLHLLPLSAELRQAIIAAKSLKSYGAIKRQAQLIGKLLRSDDYEAIITAYIELQQLRQLIKKGSSKPLFDYLRPYVL